MKLIVSHTKPDFDALASLALAKRLHPGATLTTVGSLNTQLELFVHLYRDVLSLTPYQQIQLEDVSELIVVDTCDPSRIKPFDALLGRVPVTVYDHHPRSEDSIPAVRGLHKEIGATASILTLLLKKQGVRIAPELASLALLGIHEDTGHFLFESSSPDDHEAAMHLLTCGANLTLVQQYSSDSFSEAQRAFFMTLLQEATEERINGHPVVIASVTSDTYLPGISIFCNQLLSLYQADAAIVLSHMEGKTFVIARGRNNMNVGAALAQALDGGGHAGAGFAKTNLPLKAAKTRILDALRTHTPPVLSAKDLMSTPVKTITQHSSVRDAQALLVQFGHNGLPVVDDAGKLVGVISRRDLDRAFRHGLGSSEVRGYMTKNVITATPDMGLRELEQLVQTHNVGRLPVVINHEVIGIITRSDLIRARHAPTIDAAERDATPAQRVMRVLPAAAQDALRTARDLLPAGALFIVGGTVRDALLGVGMQDLDVVVEGTNAETLASSLQRHLGGELSCHFDFGTCTLTLSNGLIMDVATAREEYYAHPGALPQVRFSTLRKDLARRDFTINTLALRVAPEPLTLIDPYGGLRDLQDKRLRILHPLSFTEDPTRILRGARLAGRLGLSYDTESERQLQAALNTNVLKQISHSRLRNELMLCLNERAVTPIITHLQHYGALKHMFHLTADLSILQNLDKLKEQTPVPAESYLLALLMTLTSTQFARHRNAFNWPKRYENILKQLRDLRNTQTLNLDTYEQLPDISIPVIKALSESLHTQISTYEHVPQRRKIRGQDVLDLGLPPGPQVGIILKKVARARQEKRVTTYQQELELAKVLVREYVAQQE